MTRAFVAGVGVLLIVLLLVGLLLWWTEREHNEEQFPAHPIRRIGNGLWLALVTMTTVGYGDRAAVAVKGRIIAGVWVVISMITASSLTASIATALTLSQLGRGTIDRADQLAGERVAAVCDSPAAHFVQSHRGRLVEVDDLEHAVEAVRAGDVEAIVADRPILQYFIKQHPETQLVLSDTR